MSVKEQQHTVSSAAFVDVFGLRVFSDTLDKIPLGKDGCKVVNTISPNSYGISTKDPLFREALKQSDYLVLDGVYFALASILLNRKNILKNQGPDVFYYFMNKMNSTGGRVFFLGASEAILEKIKIKAAKEYPNISVGTYSPPYKPEFTPADNLAMTDAINAFAPDVLFIGMTCPKQEKWAYQHKSRIHASLACCVGAVFDWYAGNQKEIHPIWWKLRLGWLKRTIDRPEILYRYPNIGIFFKDLFLTLIRLKRHEHYE